MQQHFAEYVSLEYPINEKFENNFDTLVVESFSIPYREFNDSTLFFAFYVRVRCVNDPEQTFLLVWDQEFNPVTKEQFFEYLWNTPYYRSHVWTDNLEKFEQFVAYLSSI